MTIGELIDLFLYLNAILIVITIVFVKPRRLQSIYLWIAAFVLLPIVFVLIFYLFFGRDYRRAKMFKSKGATDKLMTDYLRKMRERLFVCSDDHEELCRYAAIAKLLLDSNQALVTTNNSVTYFNEGDRLFEVIFEEIRDARRFIHMEYYLFRNDDLGRRLVHELASKAKQGSRSSCSTMPLDAIRFRRPSSRRSLDQAARRPSSSRLCSAASTPGSTIEIIARY